VQYTTCKTAKDFNIEIYTLKTKLMTFRRKGPIHNKMY